MVLDLTDGYVGWLKSAEAKYKKRDYFGAMENALQALSYSRNGDTLLTLAKIYLELDQFDACMDVCYEITASKLFAVSDPRYGEMIEIMCSALDGLHLFDVSLLLRVHSMYSFRDDMDPLGSASWARTFKEIGDEFERRRRDLEEKEDDEVYFSTASEERDDYNESVLDRIRLLEGEEDYEQELRLIDSMYAGAEYYVDTTFYAGKLCLREYGDAERAAEYFKRVLAVEPDHLGANIALAACGEEYKEGVSKFLHNVEIDQAKILVEAVFACFALGEKERATFFAEKLVSKDPKKRYNLWLLFMSQWNNGNKDGANKTLEKINSLIPTFFPLDYLKSVRLPKEMLLRFQRIPLELHKRMTAKLLKNVSKENLSNEDYLKAVSFVLCEAESPSQVDDLILKIADVESKESYDYLASLLLRFSLSFEMRGYVLLTLLRSVKLKKVTMLNNGYLVDIKLTPPKDYDYFPPILEDTYEQLFEHFAMTGVSGFENSLNKTMTIANDNFMSYHKNDLVCDNLAGILLIDAAKRMKIKRTEFLFTSADLDYEKLDELHRYYLSLIDEQK